MTDMDLLERLAALMREARHLPGRDDPITHEWFLRAQALLAECHQQPPQTECMPPDPRAGYWWLELKDTPHRKSVAEWDAQRNCWLVWLPDRAWTLFSPTSFDGWRVVGRAVPPGEIASASIVARSTWPYYG